MKQKDISEGPISALKSLGRATQQGIAKGYQAARPGGALGPDAAQNAIANFFDPKSGGKAEPVKDKKTLKKKEPTQTTANSKTYVFQDGDDVYSWDSQENAWVTADGSKKLKKSVGARMWSKASKRYPEGKNQKFKEDIEMKKVQEGLADLADAAERDHEVQMARAELYKLAKYSIKLHDMLKNVSEAEGLEGWVQSKITKAGDYISSVYHSLDYESKFGEISDNEVSMSSMSEARDTHCSDKCCGSDVKAEDCTCPPTCKHCNCNAVKEGKSPHKKGTKKYKAHMAAKHAGMKEDAYKSNLSAMLERKLSKDESKKKKST